jgi:galactonate dehydratase
LLRREFLNYFVAGASSYSLWLREARAAGTSRVPKLKIKAIKALRLRDLNNHFVRVYTDQGLHETGETFDTIGVTEIVNSYLGPALAGRDPLDIEAIYQDLWTTQVIPGGQRPAFMRGMGGPYLSAVSATEMALWDLAGRALNVPAYRLFGGKVRDKVAVYFPSNSAARAAEVVRTTGVRALKLAADEVLERLKAEGKVSNLFDPARSAGLRLTTGEIDALAAVIASVREAVGPEIGIAVDPHTKFDTESAIQLAVALEPYRLLWLEEPVPSDNRDALAEVRRRTRTPIAYGENVYTRYGFREILERQAASIIQPDVGKCGGLWEARKIAALAEIHYVPVAAHGVFSPLGTMASAQFGASIPNFMIQEWARFLHPVINGVAAPLPYRAGYLEIPDLPGLGVELKDDVLQELAAPGSPRL